MLIKLVAQLTVYKILLHLVKKHMIKFFSFHFLWNITLKIMPVNDSTIHFLEELNYKYIINIFYFLFPKNSAFR